ncbi:MAG: EamA family transporter [Anaerolineae bacterium]
MTRTDVLVLCVVVIWAATFSVVKIGLREISPLAFAAVRFSSAAVMLLIWVWVAEGRPIIKREDWFWVILVGLTAVGVYQVFFTLGLHYTTASNSSLILATVPAWTAMLAAASRQERIARLQVLGILLSFGGVALTMMGGGGHVALTWENVRGDILTLIAAALTASSGVISKRPLQRYSALRVMSVAMVCGSLFLVLVAWPEMVAQEWARVSLAGWLALAFTTVLGAGIAFVIWFKSIGEIGASRTAIYNNLIPPVAIVIAFTTLGERLAPLQALGALVVLAGVALTRFAQAQTQVEEVSPVSGHRQLE